MLPPLYRSQVDPYAFFSLLRNVFFSFKVLIFPLRLIFLSLISECLVLVDLSSFLCFISVVIFFFYLSFSCKYFNVVCLRNFVTVTLTLIRLLFSFPSHQFRCFHFGGKQFVVVVVEICHSECFFSPLLQLIISLEWLLSRGIYFVIPLSLPFTSAYIGLFMLWLNFNFHQFPAIDFR